MGMPGCLTTHAQNFQTAGCSISDLTFSDANDDGKITLKELSNARENIGIGDALEMIF